MGWKANGRAGMSALAGICVAFGAACAGADDAATLDTTAAVPPATAVGADSAMMSDADIIAQTTMANTAEMATSSLAVDRATNAEVRQFAQRMIEDHQAAQGQIDSLSVRMGLAMQQSPDSMDQALAQRRDALQGMSGADFDREYMAMQVDMHQNTLTLLNRAVAATQTAELRSTLEALIPTIQAHLDQARQIQQQLGTATTG